MPTGNRAYAVMGATGHVGKVVAERLLKAGSQVRLIGRSAERLKNLVDRAVIPHVAAFDDVEALRAATRK